MYRYLILTLCMILAVWFLGFSGSLNLFSASVVGYVSGVVGMCIHLYNKERYEKSLQHRTLQGKIKEGS